VRGYKRRYRRLTGSALSVNGYYRTDGNLVISV
jgi:hypothetical protein